MVREMLKITMEGEDDRKMYEQLAKAKGKELSSVMYQSNTSGLRAGERKAIKRLMSGKTVELTLYFTDHSTFNGHIRKVRIPFSQDQHLELYGDFV
jgi:hypothetical protein